MGEEEAAACLVLAASIVHTVMACACAPRSLPYRLSASAGGRWRLYFHRNVNRAKDATALSEEWNASQGDLATPFIAPVAICAKPISDEKRSRLLRPLSVSFDVTMMSLLVSP